MCGSNICYAYFMIIKAISEYYLQNNHDVPGVTEVMGITGPFFISQDRRSYLPLFFQHSVEEAATESKKNVQLLLCTISKTSCTLVIMT